MPPINPTDLPGTYTAPPRFLDNGTGGKVLQPERQTLLTTTVITTAATSTTPFGFATAAQADTMVAMVNRMAAAMYEGGLLKTITTPNPTV